MSGRIYYIDFSSVIANGRIFCENGNSSFTFYIIVVHNSFGNHLIFPERAALLEHFVDKGSFTVIDVGYNGYVS